MIFTVKVLCIKGIYDTGIKAIISRTVAIVIADIAFL